MNATVSAFFAKHNFPVNFDIFNVAEAILQDMNLGLKKQKSDEDMILTYCNPPKNSAKNESVIVIDAGGTNFRSCLVSFDKNGNPTISDMEKTKMPGVEKELSKKEFFEQFAKNLEHLKNKSDRIGFCFSYPMEIQKNGDGILLGFSKEVKAPEVVGCKVGECLVETLKEHGWNSIKKITLCNDTVAALLAGATCAKDGDCFSSYIGYILGTGMNAAYLQPEDKNLNIQEQIVVCESGKFNSIIHSDFDNDFDKTTTKPGASLIEKACSGGYLGPVSLFTLKTAAREKLFSDSVCDSILLINQLSLIEVDKFLHSPYCEDSILGNIAKTKATEQDCDIMFQILDAIVERSARYAAAILTACAIQTGGGKIASKPICILCDGTTFFKTYMISERVNAYLDEILTKRLGIYWKIVSCDNDITLGAAISGLID